MADDNHTSRTSLFIVALFGTILLDSHTFILSLLCGSSNRIGHGMKHSSDSGALPTGWQAGWDCHYGAYYYFNVERGITQWQLPSDQAAHDPSVEPGQLPHPPHGTASAPDNLELTRGSQQAGQHGPLPKTSDQINSHHDLPLLANDSKDEEEPCATTSRHTDHAAAGQQHPQRHGAHESGAKHQDVNSIKDGNAKPSGSAAARAHNAQPPSLGPSSQQAAPDSLGDQQTTSTRLQGSDPTDEHEMRSTSGQACAPSSSSSSGAGWYYYDPQGDLQGPFSTDDLRSWCVYLPMDLTVYFLECDDPPLPATTDAACDAADAINCTPAVELAELLADEPLVQYLRYHQSMNAGGLDGTAGVKGVRIGLGLLSPAHVGAVEGTICFGWISLVACYFTRSMLCAITLNAVGLQRPQTNNECHLNNSMGIAWIPQSFLIRSWLFKTCC